jgi:ETC complex I subunit conserved region
MASAYSPIPAFPRQRGEDEPLSAATISGAPLDLQARTVRIFKPSKTATQSGNWNGKQWRLDWDPLPKGHRWENTLMGWQSSGDFMQGTHIFFKTKEDAIHFAEKQGISCLYSPCWTSANGTFCQDTNGLSRSPMRGNSSPRLMPPTFLYVFIPMSLLKYVAYIANLV